MTRAKKKTGRGKSRPVRDLAAKPAASSTASGGETKLRRFSATMYTEQVKLTLNEYDA